MNLKPTQVTEKVGSKMPKEGLLPATENGQFAAVAAASDSVVLFGMGNLIGRDDDNPCDSLTW